MNLPYLPRLDTWTGRATVALVLLVAGIGAVVVWNEIRPPPVEPTLASYGSADGHAGEFGRLLGWAVHHDETVGQVVDALHSDKAGVRKGAVAFLAVIAATHSTTRDLAPLLRERAFDPNEDLLVRQTALEAGRLPRVFRAPQDLAPLVAIATSRNDLIAPSAMRAIASLGDAGLPILLGWVESDDSWMRDHACIALGFMGAAAKAAIPALRRRLEDPDRGVRIQATAAIEKIDASVDVAERGSHLGDAGADAGEREMLRWMKELGVPPR